MRHDELRRKQDDLAQSFLFENRKPMSGLENWRQCFPEIVGRSVVMQNVLETVSKVSRSDSAVLILGESGTGKELIASAIHRLSPRSHRSFVPLNCSAIPETLLESELFGHERGAFTGADRKRIGHFENATQGTIFLDEIGDMPASLQAKLLRVLQDRRFTPLGGSESKEANVRIIAATNKNLEQAVKRGEFRLDLYYRLNVLPVTLPPLRERSDDIPDLLEHFVDISCRNQSISEHCYFAEDAMRFLKLYDWPGNVRQLQNLVERLVILKGGGVIYLQDLPQELLAVQMKMEVENTSRSHGSGETTPSRNKSVSSLAALPRLSSLSRQGNAPDSFGGLPEEGLDLVKFVESLENDLIKQALERTNNNKNQAAKLLGLNRTTLVERIKKRQLVPLNEPSKEL